MLQYVPVQHVVRQGNGWRRCFSLVGGGGGGSMHDGVAELRRCQGDVEMAALVESSTVFSLPAQQPVCPACRSTSHSRGCRCRYGPAASATNAAAPSTPPPASDSSNPQRGLSLVCQPPPSPETRINAPYLTQKPSPPPAPKPPPPPPAQPPLTPPPNPPPPPAQTPPAPNAPACSSPRKPCETPPPPASNARKNSSARRWKCSTYRRTTRCR